MELVYLIVDDNEGVVAICDTSEKAGELYDKWVSMCDGNKERAWIDTRPMNCIYY